MEQKRFGLPQEGLKLLAAATMLIDHMGLVLFHNNLILRLIGRLAFPIYVFLLVEGVEHSRNRMAYLGRLALFAVISEVPFDLMVFGRLSCPDGQSVMLTLFLAAACLVLMQEVRDLKRAHRVIVSLLGILTACVMAETARTDYSAYGILLAVLLYCTRDLPHRRLIQFAGMLLLGILCFGIYTPQHACVLAVPLFCLYNGTRRNPDRRIQYAFYAFYPVHMLILGLAGLIM